MSLIEGYHGLRAASLCIVDPGQPSTNLPQSKLTISAVTINNITVSYQQLAWDDRNLAFEVQLLADDNTLVGFGNSVVLRTRFGNYPGYITLCNNLLIRNVAGLPIAKLRIFPMQIFNENGVGFLGFNHISFAFESISFYIFSTSLATDIFVSIPVPNEAVSLTTMGSINSVNVMQYSNIINNKTYYPIQKANNGKLITTDYIEISINDTWFSSVRVPPFISSE
jgi:hypothetical protein